MNNNINKKDLGSNPSAVESVFFSTQRFSKFFNIWIIITVLFFTFIQILLENLQFNNLSLKSRFHWNRMS